MINHIMKHYNTYYIVLIPLLFLSGYFGYLEDKNDEKILKQVKAGELILSCALNDDWQKSEVNPKLVIDYSAKHWTFINGSAENCKLEKKTK